MERNDVIAALKAFFNVKELVCDHTYARHGERSWMFLDTDYLHCLLVIRRDILKVPMTCNHSAAKQRGLRCNMCDLVMSKTRNYLSAHVLGKGGDFTCQDMTAEEARTEIERNQDLLPSNIRLEDGVTWLHMDVLPKKDCRVYRFKV